MKRFFFFLLLISVSYLGKAQNHENLRISLLTVEPRANQVYTIFGHTALRLQNAEPSYDVVFNWGTFDFNKPNFIPLFMKGETDYFLSVSDFSSFYYSYAMGNATITEQILNIPEDQKDALIAMLQNNLHPENLEYRYNFIFDNCTSRVRDIIENFCGGQLNYPEQKEEVTFRKLIHECTKPYPWLEAGIDCLIGNGADSLVSVRNELWLPVKLKEALDHSAVTGKDGSRYPIVLSSHIILSSQEEEEEDNTSGSSLNGPLISGYLLLVLLIGILFAAYLKKRRYRFVPAVLFLVAGIGGCIVAITCFFSIHPCTWPNWNIVWLHPFHLIGFAGFFFRRMNRWITWYHRLNFVLLTVFLLGWSFIPQTLNPAFIPYILCMVLVSGFQLPAFKKKDL